MAAQFIVCRLFIILFAFLVLFLSTTGKIAAQSSYPSNSNTPVNQSYDQFLRNVNEADRTGKQNYDSIWVSGITRAVHSVTYVLIGDSSGDTHDKKTIGLIGIGGNLLGSMYANPPASGVSYVAYMGKEAKLIPQAYAQDNQGFNQLRPLLPFWSAMRNVAYLFFVPIFLYTGLMIMLRQKAGQAALSVQQALPKIILALVLVTFSFAIVGFLIDVMNVLMAFILQYFVATDLISNKVFTDDFYNKNLFNFASEEVGIWHIANGPGQAVGGFISKLVNDFIDIKFLDSLLGRLLGGAAELVATFIFLLAVTFTLFQTIIMLIKAYIYVILGIVFAPILLAFSAFPNSKSASNWLRNILSNLVVFPAVLVLLLTAVVLGNFRELAGPAISESGAIIGEDRGWVPPFIGAFAGSRLDGIRAFIGFGIFLLMPTALKQAQKFFKAEAIANPYFAPVQQAASKVGGGLANSFTKGKYAEWRKREEENNKTRNQQATSTSGS